MNVKDETQERVIHPKGSMCMACAKRNEVCNYNFRQMPIIQKYYDSERVVFVVKCTYFERENAI